MEIATVKMFVMATGSPLLSDKVSTLLQSEPRSIVMLYGAAEALMR